MAELDEKSKVQRAARNHAQYCANKRWRIFVVAFNLEKYAVPVSCELSKFAATHPHGLTDDDIIYTATPGLAIPPK